MVKESCAYVTLYNCFYFKGYRSIRIVLVSSTNCLWCDCWHVFTLWWFRQTTYRAMSWILNLIDSGLNSGLLKLCSHSYNKKTLWHLLIKYTLQSSYSVSQTELLQRWALITFSPLILKILISICMHFFCTFWEFRITQIF